VGSRQPLPRGWIGIAEKRPAGAECGSSEQVMRRSRLGHELSTL
jgi:hypothetical protein